METDQDNKKSDKKAALYAVLCYLFSLLLSIFWSVDSSFAYIFSGIAILFLFLTFKNVHFKKTSFQYDHFEEVKDDKVTESSDVLHDLKSALKDKGISFGAEPKNASPQQANQRIVLMVVGGIVIFFFSLVFIGIFSSDAGDEQFYYQQAEVFYDETLYDSAGRYFRKALAINEESTEALTGLGNTFLMKGQNDSSLIMYNKALALDPEYETARYQKALVLSYLKQYDEAVNEAKDLLELNPQYLEAMQLIGDTYYNQEKYDDAETWYDSAYAKGLRNRYLCHLMGYINQTNGKTQQAINLYKEALKYDSSVVDIYERLLDIVPDNEKEWCKEKISQYKSEQ
jgi:tetratricopeptide (TPR) repeat protein